MIKHYELFGVSRAGIKALLWQQLCTAVTVPGDSREAEAGLCLT